MILTQAEEFQKRIETAEKGYIIEAIGLRILRPLDQSELTILGSELAQNYRSRCYEYGTACWALGDWLVAGGKQMHINPHGRGPTYEGSQYDFAQKVTGFSRPHLSRLYRVAVAFPYDMRRLGLAFNVHEECLRVPEELRGELLTRAEAEDWSQEDMRQHINGIEARAANTRAIPVQKSLNRNYIHSHVKCPSCSHVFTIKDHKVERPVPIPGASKNPGKWGGFKS